MIQHNVINSDFESLAVKWKTFLKPYEDQFENIVIEYKTLCPTFIDEQKRKFQIDFISDRTNYHKVKSGLQREPLSRAVGAGKYGRRILDLSAGLGIDALFLAQMGYEVTAVERNPLIYLALEHAATQLTSVSELKVKFIFAEALSYLKGSLDDYDVAYFDPMFPSKNKSALPRQEMLFFKDLVGHDDDASQVLATALQLKKFKRIAVKRPLAAPTLLEEQKLKPVGQIKGKIIRYDIY